MPGKKMNRGYFPLILVILIIITLPPLLCGCAGGRQPQRKPAGGQEIRIAVSLADLERDGNQIIKRAMTARAGEGGQGGQKVSITWLDAGNDPARQEKDLEQLADQKVRAVVLQPVDPAAGPGLVRKLARAGIKVVALDTLPADSPLDGYIAFDHARAGELQARYLLEMARGRNAPVKAVILTGDKNDQASREVAASLLENLREHPQVQVVQVKDHPRGDPQAALVTLEQALAAAGGRLDAVLATDSRLAAAAAEMLKSRGLDRQVVTLGVGAGQKACQALAAGEHDAEVDVMPDLMAQYAFDAALGLAATGHWQYDRQVKNGDFDVPARVTPVRLVTAEEAYLLEQRWGPLTGGEGQQAGRQGQSGGAREGGSQGSAAGGRKTTLKITTRDGKTVEMQIDGEIQKIETVDSGRGEGGGAGGGSQAGSNSQSGGGS